jgi:aldehyde:ferredoxin oxidoreductase
MGLLYGYAGSILEANLLARKAVKKELDLQIARNFIGGLGFNTKMLYDSVGPNVNPLSPDNIVAISPGALTGTSAPTACRTEVTTKSPLTGIIGTGNVGGFWGPALRYAGYDAIVVRNRSERPVYLLIDDDQTEIREATHLWGKDSWETTDILKKELGQDFSVMSIGQAGENLVRYATVVVDYQHAPGRSHAGAVLGVKKLKAIAVRGTGRIVIRSVEEFQKAVRESDDKILSYPGWKIREKTGTTAVTFPEYEATAEEYMIKGDDWSFCPCSMGRYYGCTLATEIKAGKYAGTKVLGAGLTLHPRLAYTLGISLPAAWKYKELHNRYGMDCWCLSPVTFAMELYQRGIITKKDTDGLALVRGNESDIMKMPEKIAHRDGFGSVLAEGSVIASTIIGRNSEKYVRAVKGLEFVDDPRVMKWEHQLSYLTNPRGGDDLKGTHALHDFPGLPEWARRLGWDESKYLEWLLNRLDMFDDVKKGIFGVPPRLSNLDGAMLTKWYNDLTCIYNCLGLCMFSCTTVEALGPTLYAKLLSASTGWDISPLESMRIGERIFNMMRAYIVREGMTREHDHWPRRFYEEPLPDSPAEVTTWRIGTGSAAVSREKIDQLLDQYYELREWDKKKGIPTEGKLRKLQLDDVADDLRKKGFLKN